MDCSVHAIPTLLSVILLINAFKRRDTNPSAGVRAIALTHIENHPSCESRDLKSCCDRGEVHLSPSSILRWIILLTSISSRHMKSLQEELPFNR